MGRRLPRVTVFNYNQLLSFWEDAPAEADASSVYRGRYILHKREIIPILH